MSRMIVWTIGAIFLVLVAIGFLLPVAAKPDPLPPHRHPTLEARDDELKGDILRLQLQLADLTRRLHVQEARPEGLTGPEVRDLVEVLLPPPVDVTLDPTPPEVQ